MQNQTSNAVAIFEPQNVQAIAQMGPEAFSRNTSSHAACLKAGQALLDRANSEGMSDALDQEIAKFINKAKITLKNMNDRRSPVTQLFDQLRKAYTALENDVDPSKSGTIGYQLQAARNAYAAKKREEAERQRREEAARQALEQARARYRQDLEDDYKKQFNSLVVTKINEINALDRSITLANFDVASIGIKEYPTQLPASWEQSVHPCALLPAGIALDESRKMQASVLASLIPSFREQYEFEISGTRDEVVDRLPSKRKELQRIAEANAEEAARIQAEMKAREAAEAARKEQERIERENKEKAAAELAAQKTEMDSLFGAPIAPTATYAPKTQVKKRVVAETADDYMAIVAFWWAQEGQKLPADELAKIFKKMVTYADKCANSANPTYIVGVRYEDEVKAK